MSRAERAARVEQAVAQISAAVACAGPDDHLAFAEIVASLREAADEAEPLAAPGEQS